MTTKTQRDLNLEYWGRIHDMCDTYNKEHGTSIKPRQCVKYYGNVWNLWNLPIKHPVFDDKNYDLACFIIDDKPVFVGDKIYHKTMKHLVTIIEGAFYDCRYWTLTPPKPQRTFELNGQQLPCPVNDNTQSTLDFIGHQFDFATHEDRDQVAYYILDILENARDKE